MAFNNPATTIDGSDVEGTLTGNTIQTAEPGTVPRIALNDPAYPGEIILESSLAEIEPARIRPQIGDANHGTLELRSPNLSGTGYAFIDMEGFNDGHSTMTVQADNVEIIGADTLDLIGAPVRIGDGSDFITIEGERAYTGTGVWTDVAAAGPADGAFLNSWVPYAAGGVPDPGWILDPDGYVTLKGWAKDGSAGNAVIFNMPAGLRPYPTSGKHHSAVTMSNGVLCRILVNTTTGAVSAVTGGSATWVMLDGIRFPTFG